MQHGSSNVGSDKGDRQSGRGRSCLSRQGISYRVEGDERETVVLVHGVGSSAATWSRLSPLIGGEYRLVSYDLRGHGGSAKRGGNWSLDDFVSDHLGLIGELALSRSHVVGFSLGALVALGVALTAPSTVSRLVLLNCVGDRREDERSRALERLAYVRTHPMDEIAREAPRDGSPQGSSTARERTLTPK